MSAQSKVGTSDGLKNRRPTPNLMPAPTGGGAAERKA
jgi:hypothetical protein